MVPFELALQMELSPQYLESIWIFQETCTFNAIRYGPKNPRAGEYQERARPQAGHVLSTPTCECRFSVASAAPGRQPASSTWTWYARPTARKSPRAFLLRSFMWYMAAMTRLGETRSSLRRWHVLVLMLLHCRM